MYTKHIALFQGLAASGFSPAQIAGLTTVFGQCLLDLEHRGSLSLLGERPAGATDAVFRLANYPPDGTVDNTTMPDAEGEMPNGWAMDVEAGAVRFRGPVIFDGPVGGDFGVFQPLMAVLWLGDPGDIPSGWAMCLTGDSMVSLADGSMTTIADIVDNRRCVSVVSLDESSGKFVSRRVTGWYKREASRSDWLRLCIAKGRGCGRRSLTITNDHPVLTSSGWREASTLSQGDYVVRHEMGLSRVGQQAIIGMFLGDGSVSSSGRFSVTHGSGQADYAEFVSSKLRVPLESMAVASPAFGGDGQYVRCRMSLKSVCRETFDLLSQRRDKANDDVLNRLDPIALAFWYMDDGQLVSDKRHPEYQRARLHTQGFSSKELDRIEQAMEERFGISCKRWRHYPSQPEKNLAGCLLQLDKGSSQKFFDLISPYVVPSMRYKIPEQYRHVPFVLGGKDFRETRPVSYKVQSIRPLGEYADSKKYGRKFSWRYDIRVEDTHNFVANGFVVHNCNGVDNSIANGGSGINLTGIPYPYISGDPTYGTVGDAVTLAFGHTGSPIDTVGGGTVPVTVDSNTTGITVSNHASGASCTVNDSGHFHDVTSFTAMVGDSGATSPETVVVSVDTETGVATTGITVTTPTLTHTVNDSGHSHTAEVDLQDIADNMTIVTPSTIRPPGTVVIYIEKLAT